MQKIDISKRDNYRIGDFVYIEENPFQPYSIGKITHINEEKGKVYLRTVCYNRRRDMTQSNLQRVDRHTAYLPGNEHSYEWNHPECSYSREEIHNIRLRELITTRGDDDHSDRKISPNMLRGKCHMSRYCPLENAFSYLSKPDVFYFSTIFEPDTRNVSVEGNEINIGPMNQAIIPNIDPNYMNITSHMSAGTLMWDCNKFSTNANEECFKKYSKLVRSICIVGRLIDPAYSCKYGDIRQIANIASRDSAVEFSLNLLHTNNYNVQDTVQKLVSNVKNGNYTIVHDTLDSWCESDIELFQKNIISCHKDFSLLQKKYLPWKSIPELIEFYYLWKTTTAYDNQKRKQEAKILSIFVSTSIYTSSAFANSIPHQKLLNLSQESTRIIHHAQCVSCKVTKSDRWFPWLPSGISVNKSTKYYLCSDCWIHWKKYGGLKRPDPLDRSCTEEATLKCNKCNKVFPRNDRFNAHMHNFHPYRCSISNCSQYYDTKNELMDHHMYSHFEGIDIPKQTMPDNNDSDEFFFVASSDWIKLRNKILTKNPHLYCLNLDPMVTNIQKLIIEGFRSRRKINLCKQLMAIPNVSNNIKKQVNNLEKPDFALECALNHHYIQKFNIQHNGSPVDSCTIDRSKALSSNAHAVYTTNIHYSLYSSNNRSQSSGATSSSNHSND